MPARVCDRSPCHYMAKAMNIFLMPDGNADKFNITVLSKPDKQLPILVTLEYCPFCGTRIDPEWVKEMRARSSKRGG